MKKDYSLNDDELDLIELLRTIFNSKIKIVTITVITILIAYGYDYRIPKSFTSSLIIKPNTNSEFLLLEALYKNLNAKKKIPIDKTSKTKQTIPIEKIILDEFIYELMDYDELILILKDNQQIKEITSKLSEDKQKKKLFNYAKSLTIDDQDFPNYRLNFDWNNIEEAKYILEQTINLTIINFENSLYKELTERLNIEKNTALSNDLDRANYLREQSVIARELGIANNQVDSINLSMTGGSRLKVNTDDVAYYLRGYIAIEKEIELIKKRKYVNFTDIKKQINFLKEKNINWIDYNIYLIEVEPNKKTTFTLLISIIIGITLGVFYALISNAFQTRKNQEIETNQA